MSGEMRADEARAYARTSLAISNLRGVFILILVAFHACLPYLGSTKGPSEAFNAPPYLWLAFPIVDERRFFGFDLFCAWEDVHVMALMFFVSGLFAAPGLKRKGAVQFTLDRLTRLGLPFLLCVLVLMPIAIYPVFHRLEPDANLADYAAAYGALPFLPNGPTWFLWMLIGFSLILAAIYAYAPQTLDRLASLVREGKRQPERVLLALFAAAILAYAPLTQIFGPFDWFERGPFSFQLSRPLLYGVYFFAGAAIGAQGLASGLLAPDGALIGLCRRLGILAPIGLFAWMGITGVTLAWPDFAPLLVRTLSSFSYVAASVFGVMFLLAVSLRYCARPFGWLELLSRNSLGIFVLHYAPLVWMQYALTGVNLPAILKAPIVFAVVLAASLAASCALKRSRFGAALIGEFSARAAPA